MSQYITELDVSLDETQEKQLEEKGFTKIDVDLNKGTLVHGNTIYLWYKRGSSLAITRIQISFSESSTVPLEAAGYHKIDKDLNAGALGNFLYLWYYKGCTQYDVSIVDLHVSTEAEDEAQMFASGWERLACDLNRWAGGNWIHLWVKRETPVYLCEITASAKHDEDVKYFENGYIRVDEDTNRGAGGAYIYIFYRQTTDKMKAITDLKVSTNKDEYISMKNQNYQLVNQNLNQDTEGNPVYLWYQKFIPIKAVTVLINPAAVEAYKKARIPVIPKNLDEGNPGSPEYLCFKHLSGGGGGGGGVCPAALQNLKKPA